MFLILKRKVWLVFEGRTVNSSQNKLGNEIFRYFNSQPEKKNEKRVLTHISLESKHNIKDVESRWYDWWQENNFFKPSKSEKESFIILLPPPNISGNLHLGHALTVTIQDVIMRWKRMKGESVLWIPGIDHAGIATQVLVEKHLLKTLGITKDSLDKQKFLEYIWEWKKEKSNKIIEELKIMGASLDWSKLKFTLDSDHSKLVSDSFIKLHNEGLIYRNKSLINWSCFLKSSISDIEVVNIDVKKAQKLEVPGYTKPVKFGLLYDFAYKVVDEDDEIVVSTTRPETMLGDVAVAVHPNDPKFSRFRNKQVWHPFRKEKIPVIFDDFVNREFGSGAVKITPAHSLKDFEVAHKNQLPCIQVIDEQGCIIKVGCFDKLFGMKRFDARNVVISELQNLGLFRGSKEHEMVVPFCSRSGDVVEKILKDQWFLKTKDLADKAKEYVTSKKLKLEPKNFEKLWFHWLENSHDWNLSRQLVWGHPIPMYECRNGNDAVWLPADSLEKAKEKAALQWKTSPENVTAVKDPDVLDTWFSSSLLPLGVLPEGSSREEPPISLMVTGHDILFFWIARMVMLCSHLSGKLPFNHVLLHGLICDKSGRKMSKSVGNVINTEDIINGCSLESLKAQTMNNFADLKSQNLLKKALEEQGKMFPQGIPACGVDALRFTLCGYDFQGNLVNFDVQKCFANKHFCNKIWQSFNYYIKITDAYKERFSSDPELVELQSENLNIFEKWILSSLTDVLETIEQDMKNFIFYSFIEKIRYFTIEKFCSIYLETTKTILQDAPIETYKKVITIFHHCLETILRLLSPFMPFITEHLYHALPPLKGFERLESVTIAEYPKPGDWKKFENPAVENQTKILLEVVYTIRRIKTLFFPMKEKPDVDIIVPNYLEADLFGDLKNAFLRLTNINSLTKVNSVPQKNVIQANVENFCSIFMKHEYDRKTLMEKFKSKLKDEESLRKKLEVLLKNQKEKEDLQEVSPSLEAEFEKKCNEIIAKLKLIEEIKEVIKNCEN